MDKVLEGKRLSIKKKARKKRLSAIKFLSIPTLAVITASVINIFLKFGTFREMAFTFFLPLMVGIVLILSGQLLDPLRAPDKVILNLINSVEYLEKSVGDTDLVNDAYTQLLSAIENLESMDRGEASYYSEIRQKEVKLINNIKNLIAPAILTGDVTHIVLEEIALLFTDPNASRMETINLNLEKQFKPIDVAEKKPEGIIESLRDKTIGKILLSFISGFGFVLSLAWVGSMVSEEFAKQVRSNSFGLFGFCIMLTVGFITLFSKDKIN